MNFSDLTRIFSRVNRQTGQLVAKPRRLPLGAEPTVLTVRLAGSKRTLKREFMAAARAEGWQGRSYGSAKKFERKLTREAR